MKSWLIRDGMPQFIIVAVVALIVGSIIGALVGSSVNPAVIAVFGTIGGATIGAIASSWLSEYYKRYRDTKAISYALAGELASHIEAMSDQALDAFQQLAELAKRDTFPGFPPFEASDLVYDKSVDKLGLLESDIPQRLVTTYGRIKACRGGLQNIAKGLLKEDQSRIAAHIESYVAQWKLHIRPNGLVLIEDLNKIGARTFWESLRLSVVLER